jgi:DNA-directed RNA polymerase subunit RPC12/RpoP
MKKAIVPKCPNCNYAEFLKVAEGKYKCLRCGEIWEW